MRRLRLLGLHKGGVLAWSVTGNIETEERAAELLKRKETEITEGTTVDTYLKDCVLVVTDYLVSDKELCGDIIMGPEQLKGKTMIEAMKWLKDNPDIVEVELMGTCPVCYYKKKHGEF